MFTRLSPALDGEGYITLWCCLPSFIYTV